jgi:thiol-disulfide isomerase/thioredoxin
VQGGQELDLTGPTVAGEKFDLKQLRGKVVLVDFWATWCGPCVAEMPNVKRVYDRYHKDGFEVVGVSLDNSKDALVKFLKAREVHWPQLFFDDKDAQGWNNPLARKYGVNSIPFTVLVDRAGKVARIGVRGEALRAAVAQLLGKEAAPPPVLAQAQYQIRLSQWDKAAAEYADADLLSRPPRDDALAYASLLLLRGDNEGYNRFCRHMIQGAQTEDPCDAYFLARSCATARKCLVDPAQVVQWANQAVASDPVAWNYHVLGLAQYRAGQLDQALESFTKANATFWRYSELNWFGLALVHHSLGHTGEARRCLDKGIQWLERVGPPRPGQPARLLPTDWLEAHLLRREAEELLQKKQAK